MRQIALGTFARSLLGGAIVGMGGSVGSRVANAFQITPTLDRTRAIHWMLLITIIGLGAVLRFWGLGSIGLHGDEETMGLAVRNIVATGVPILPGGMFYPRGMTQLYLMAGSVMAFGESEWALRLPSVLCGIVLIPLSYLLARRFLRPTWSLAFAATIAFLPILIIDSQTARMYIFLVTFITASMVCLFAWERTDRTGWLVASLVALSFALDMHALAVATVLMFLVPGLVRGDIRRLLYGSAAALAGVVAFLLIDGWVNSNYPIPPADFGNAFGPPPRQAASVSSDFSLVFDVLLWGGGAAAVFLAWRLRTGFEIPVAAAAALAAFVTAIVLQLALFYHAALICFVAGVVVSARYGTSVARPIAIICSIMLLVLCCHLALLAPVAGTPIRLVGALVGQPSVWPYVRIAQLSPFAAVVAGALIAWGLYRLSRRERVTDYWLLAVTGVWAPIFALGLFAWNVPPRYTEMSLMPMLVAAFAALQAAADWLFARAKDSAPATAVPVKSSARVAVFATVATIFAVNPSAVIAAVSTRDKTSPDHKGAAEFIRAQNISDADIVIAEDILQQTYYLGRVDYWLIGPQVARRFVKLAESGVVDFYTGTPVIVTPAMLEDVLSDNPDKRIFVIGSGEDWRAGRREVRENLHELIESARFETVFTGRDGRTRVVRAVSAASTATLSSQAANEMAPASPELSSSSVTPE